MDDRLVKHKRGISFVLAVLLVVTAMLPAGLMRSASAAAETIASWTFAAGHTGQTSIAAVGGNDANKEISTFRTSSERAMTYSTTGNTVYASGWNTPDQYWEIKVNTEGYTDLGLSFNSYGSSTAPRDFKLQYSLDGAGFADVPDGTLTHTSNTARFVFALPSETDNQAEVYIRWLNTSDVSISGSTVSPTGNSRMADIVLEGESAAGPRASAITASHPSNAWPAGTEVELRLGSVGETIHYAVDGGAYEPYTAPIVIDGPLTIEAYASADGYADSLPQTFRYSVLEKQTIAEARLTPRSANAWIEGVITHIAGQEIYVQDETAGIVLYGYDLLASPGDRVAVQGWMDVFNGLEELRPDDRLTYEVTDDNAGIPAPLLLTGADLASDQGEQHEAKLVSLEDVTVTGKNGLRVTATQGGAEFIIYSPSAKLEPGATFVRVTGVVKQYQNDYQLIPLNDAALVDDLLSVTASPAAGRIIIGNAVALSTPSSSSVIYYTADGSEPAAGTSPVYAAPIVVTEDVTIRAVALDGDQSGDIYEFAYTAVEQPRIHDIQGEGHLSEYADQKVEDIVGIVTQYGYRFTNGAYTGFYMQDPEPDGNDNTSEAIYVYSTFEDRKPAIGDLISVSGTVVEYNEGSSSNLTTTQITSPVIEVLAHDQELPEPVLLGKGGRPLPTSIIDNDSFSAFDPEEDAIDFYESLEGMLVRLPSPTVLSNYWVSSGQVYNIPTRVENDMDDVLTDAGGLILKEEGNLNPQRLILAYGDPGMEFGTGDRFTEDIIGVIGYNFGNFKVIPPNGSLPAVELSEFERETTTIEIDEDKLTLATYNIENFYPGVPEPKLRTIAESIVSNLKAPDIIGLVEVQDNNGPADDGTVSAELSYLKLIETISGAGGPAYSFAEVAPLDKQDGGQPGGNIRVGFLYNADRVTLSESETGEAATAVTAITYDADADRLSHNPGRIDPTNPAFQSSRKPLAAQFEFNGEKVIAIVNHFNSKSGDQGPFGANQPPVLSSEAQRHQIAAVVNGFVKDVVTANPDAKVVVMGDFNDFQFTETLSILKGGELMNLVDTLPINDRYSYTFDGNSQTLDHMLVSHNLEAASEFDIVHINADFPVSRDRASDHDPMLVQVDLHAESQPGGAFELRVLHTNDTHARLDSAPRRLTAIADNRTANTILLDAGDVFSGTLYFTRFNGMADLEFMNMAGYDAMVPGNHEFDKGPAVLEAFIREAKFPIVSSNIDYSANEGLSQIFSNEIGGLTEPIEDGKLYPAIVLDVEGEQVGVIGLTTEETVGISSPGDTIVFQNYIDRAKATVAMLQDEGINKIIALTHLGYGYDEILAEEVAGIDIIVGGHSHTLLDEPVVKHADGEPTIIVQAGEYGDWLGLIDATFDEQGVLTAWDGRLLAVKDFPENEAAKAILAEFAAEIEEMKQTVVGRTNVELVYARMIDGVMTRIVRNEESNLGNLITDGMATAVREKMQGLLPPGELAEIKGYVAIQNGGGIRDGIPAGDITLGQVRTVMPFDNSIVALKVTGRELILALENGVADAPVERGSFAHVSGMRYDFDSTKTKQTINPDTGEITFAGERVVRVQVKTANGTYAPIDPDGYYMLGTNSFVAGGGDFYYSLKQAKDDGRYYELYLPDYEVFIEHLERLGTVRIAKEGRIVDLKGGKLPSEPVGGGGYFPYPPNESDPDGEEPGSETPGGESPGGGTTASGVQLDINPDWIITETDASGRTVTRVVLDGPLLNAAIGQSLRESNGTVRIAMGDTPGPAKFELPASALSGAGGATIAVSANGASYELPVQVLDVQRLAAELGVVADAMAITLEIAALTGTERQQATAAAQRIGASLLGDPVSYVLAAEGGGRTVEINGFGTTYVTRTMTLPNRVDNDRTTAAFYNPGTGEFRFVPAVFEAANGTTIATIKRNSNSVYALLTVSKSFADMNGHWAQADVALLASKLIVNGQRADAFVPNANMTRAEFAALLVRSLGLVETQGATGFSDVGANVWYSGVVGASVQAGLITGFEDGTFRPNERITREQAALMIVRAVEATGGRTSGGADQLAGFRDGDSVSSWAAEAMAMNIREGIMQGDGALLRPQHSATRAEVTVMLKRLLQYLQFIN
ncbi:5'-nucleotidase C-terminal domain-containing protein [Paenibacillus sp. 1P07SE]|uniref:5'-nucleotidase C-terminal domain-containing protein n=1 Tax=Paenibacillus sp. 1P07SE TaxID=3132209 RepID=UPI0039A5DF91